MAVEVGAPDDALAPGEPGEGLFTELGGWPGVYARLFERQNLTSDEAAAVFTEVLENRAQPAQLGALLAALRTKGETAEEIAGFVRAMRRRGESVTLLAGAADAIDTCGTGGDRSGTINVSTLAALIVAGAGGHVCKHGNRAASSQAGSADLLEAFGVSLELGPEGVARCVGESRFGFCFAQRFHPAMRYAGPVRSALGIATAFNVLGPLANPARVRRQVVGVAAPELAETVLGALEHGGAVHALVVYGRDGLDELSTVVASEVFESRLQSDGSFARRQYAVDARGLGLAPARSADLVGGDVAHNLARAQAILHGERGAQRDVVLLNAAAGLIVAGRAADFAEGLALAEESLDSGAPREVLERFIVASATAADAGLL